MCPGHLDGFRCRRSVPGDSALLGAQALVSATRTDRAGPLVLVSQDVHHCNVGQSRLATQTEDEFYLASIGHWSWRNRQRARVSCAQTCRRYPHHPSHVQRPFTHSFPPPTLLRPCNPSLAPQIAPQESTLIPRFRRPSPVWTPSIRLSGRLRQLQAHPPSTINCLGIVTTVGL